MTDRAVPGKHLVFLSTVYPTAWEPHKGPAMANLVAALRTLGCRVSVVAPVPWTAKLPRHRSASVQGGEYPTYWYTPFVLRERYHDMLWWSVRRTLDHLARRTPAPDAILAFWTHPDGTAAVRFAREQGIRSGVIAAGSDILLLPADPARRHVVSTTLRSADHLFAVGNEIARRAIALGADAARVTTFIQGVNLERFAPGDRLVTRRVLGIPGDGPLLLWVGNMVEVKAAARVIAAARTLMTTHPQLRVAMVGGGPLDGALKELAAASGALATRIIFPGPVPSAALPTWYHAANVMVLPSRSEGVPNVLLEAMATGLPFVASNVGSIADLLPFGASRTVPEGDVSALAEAIAQVLLCTDSAATEPKQFDILDGAREILHHLHLDRP